jgi:hypothetical protein
MTSSSSYLLKLTMPVRDLNAPLGQELLDISVAEGETKVHPDRTLEDVAWEPVAGVQESGHAGHLRRRAERSKLGERDKPGIATAA